VLTSHRSYGRIDILSQFFDNSQRNCLTGVDAGFLCVLPILHGAPNIYKSGIVIRYRSPLSYDLAFRNAGTRKCRSIHTLCPRRAPHPVLCSFSSARKRIPIPALFPQRVRATQLHFLCSSAPCKHMTIRFLCPLVPRKRMPIRFLCPRRASTSRCHTSLSFGTE